MANPLILINGSTLPQKHSTPHEEKLAAGKINRVEKGDVFAVVGTFAKNYEFGPLNYPKGATFVVGEEVLIAFDSKLTGWIVAGSWQIVGAESITTAEIKKEAVTKAKLLKALAEEIENSIKIGETAGGSLEGKYPNPTLAAGAVTLTNLAAALTGTAAVAIGAPKKESEITESAKGNGEKEPSSTKPVSVSIYYKMTENKAASFKVEVGGVIMYECASSAVAALKQTETAGPFIVPKATKIKVTFSECTGIIPVYQTL